MIQAVSPRVSGTVTIAASTSSANGAIGTGCHYLRILNLSDKPAHVKSGIGSSLAATTADFPVAAGQSEVIRLDSSHDRVAVILASGATSANVYVTPCSK